MVNDSYHYRLHVPSVETRARDCGRHFLFSVLERPAVVVFVYIEKTFEATCAPSIFSILTEKSHEGNPGMDQESVSKQELRTPSHEGTSSALLFLIPVERFATLSTYPNTKV